MEIFSGEWFGALASIIAIDLRIIFTGMLVYLLYIPGIKAVGALLLFWIAYRMTQDVGHKTRQVSKDKQANMSFMRAMGTIIIADAVMGLDNILAIAGAARGDLLLVAIGLVISIPIVIGGSVLILSYIKKYPWIVWAGAALLGYTGGSMLTDDAYVVSHFLEDVSLILVWLIKLLPTAALFWLGWWFHHRNKSSLA